MIQTLLKLLKKIENFSNPTNNELNLNLTLPEKIR